MHWRCCSLALSHRYIVLKNDKDNSYLSILPSWVNYVVSIESVLQKTDHIMAAHAWENMHEVTQII